MKTIEEKFKEYVHQFHDLHGANLAQNYESFKAGYELAKKELEEQLKEAENIFSRIKDLVGDSDLEIYCIEKARAYLEKWK